MRIGIHGRDSQAKTSPLIERILKQLVDRKAGYLAVF
jgi:hypothetical protein